MNVGGDSCLSIFSAVYDTGALVFPYGASVLEIGCAEADWMTPLLAERPDLAITGIDWRREERPGTVIHGDVLSVDFEPDQFDVIVGISSLEHIGLGHYDADPLDVDGDVHVAARMHRWLKPGGWVYADVPYRPDGYMVHDTSHRSYDLDSLQARLVYPFTAPTFWFANWQGTLEPQPREQGDPHLMHYVAFHARKE